MSNTAKIVAALAVLILAGVIYYVRSGGTNDLTSRTDYNAELKCRACEHQYGAKLEVTDPPPFTCPKCGKKDAWHLWKCEKCGTTFVPEPEGDPPRAPMMPTCPKCKGQSTGQVPVGA